MKLFHNLPELNLTEFAREIDMNPALMSHYVNGRKRLTNAARERMRAGLIRTRTKIDETLRGME